MLPVVAGKAETRRQILKYSLLLVPLSFMPIVLGTAGLTYGVAVAIMGAGFLLLAFRVRYEQDDRTARSLFRFSILYLFLLFGALIVERAAALAPLAGGGGLSPVGRGRVCLGDRKHKDDNAKMEEETAER